MIAARMARSVAPWRPRATRFGRAVRNVAATAALVAWCLYLRPQILGGPAAYILVNGTSMEPGLEPGALVVAIRRETYDIGDIVAYRVPAGDPAAGQNVIHRIVGGSAELGFVVRGDNVASSDIWRPTGDAIVGAAWFVAPGTAPLLLFLRSPLLFASLVTAVFTYWVLGVLDPKVRSAPG
jgi:signal peptidase I